MQKVMKFELNYVDGCGDFHEMQSALWQLQKQTREILNKTIQLSCEWEWKDKEAFKTTGQHLVVENETGYKRYDGYIYDCLKREYSSFCAGNLNATIQTGWKKYLASKKEVAVGTMSIPSYKRDQPLIFHNKSIKLSIEEKSTVITLTVFSGEYKREHQVSNPKFKVIIGDKTQKAIISNILSSTYSIGRSQLAYEKKKWFLLLTYKFNPTKNVLDEDKILGVDLGTVYAVYASIYGQFDKLAISGDEGVEQIKRVEAIKYSKQKQARYCGEGRIGHGTKTRISAVYDSADKIARIQETLNHRWSKAVVDYAIKNHCGVIQMEDLSGIKENLQFPKRLRHWTYYDLQSKINSKADEAGIRVVKVSPEYTSQRCSQCHCIHKENRPKQDIFKCINCGYTANADFNASQNISIKDIDKIIQREKKGCEAEANEKLP